MNPSPSFPFTALVGQDALKAALLAVAVDPGIGGVLIRGEKGTGKSRAVRGLAALFPPRAVVPGCPFACHPDQPEGLCESCQARVARGEPLTLIEAATPVVELPLNASEDRVVGAIDLEAALIRGRAAFQPGLLAAAHRALLYVDEVNLLDDHLVDVLLDVAVTGVNVVAREGVTCTHPARFLLIGTMNPEEGDLRPQLLDRFGLCVEVTAEAAPAQRKEIIRRALAYQADPATFAAQWAEPEAALRAQVAQARQRLPALVPAEALLDFAASVAVEMKVDGHRAEITLIQTALALAALHGHPSPSPDDLRTALPLALRHRTKRLPLQTAKLDPGAFDRLLAQAPRGEPPALGRKPEVAAEDQALPPDYDAPQVIGLAGITLAAEGPRKGGGEERRASDAPPGDEAVDDPRGRGGDERGDGSVDPIGDLPWTTRLTFDESLLWRALQGLRPPRLQAARDRRRRALSGKRTKTRTGTPRGRYVRSRRSGEFRDVALDASLRAAASRQAGRRPSGQPLRVEPADLHSKVRERKVGNLLLFLVDASSSMGTQKRILATQGAILSLLVDAYQRRDRVGLVTFRETFAETILTPTSSVEKAKRAFERIYIGGTTPLSAGLLAAYERIQHELIREPGLLPLVILITDGLPNVALARRDPLEEALEICRLFRARRVGGVVLDTEGGYTRSLAFSAVGRAPEMAEAMGAQYIPLADVSETAILDAIRQGQHASAPQA